jgi:hypothetical protein
MGGPAELTSALEAGATFAVVTAVGDLVLRFLFRSRSSLPVRWTFPLVAGYFFRQALLGVWFGVAATFGRRAFHGLLAAILVASVAGWLIVVVWFARAVEAQNSR